jgi:Protein of unknown function (DUF2848)
MTKITSPTILHLTAIRPGGNAPIDAAIDSLVIAGWTGRDPQAMEAHIVELEKLGVARPKSTPIFYRGAASLLTTASAIEVLGDHSSGEVEPVIFSLPDGLWLGVGSDHTDRKVETIGISISKQLCAKPVGPRLWPFAEVAMHWDALVIRSFATRNGQRRLYQEGPLAKMRHPDDLIARYRGAQGTLPTGTAIFCGTLAVHGEIAPADSYELELEDPIHQRKITHSYRVSVLPIEG